MRDASPLPAARRYATVALMPSTSRNCSVSAPGTMPARQCAPPSVVTAYVPPTPLAHTTRGETGLIACSRFVVPLCCGVRVGEETAFAAPTSAVPAVGLANGLGAGGAEASEQHSVVVVTKPNVATT